MNELGPMARALLDAARDGDGPEASARARVRQSLSRRLAVGLAAGTAAATVAKATTATATSTTVAALAAPLGFGTKILVTFAIATAIGMGAVTYVDSQPRTDPPAKVAPVSLPAVNASPKAPRAAAIAAPPAPSASAPASTAVYLVLARPSSPRRLRPLPAQQHLRRPTAAPAERPAFRSRR